MDEKPSAKFLVGAFIGLFAFGFSMAFFVGISASAVAPAFVPLAFAFLAAGGLLYDFYRKKDKSAPSPAERVQRIGFFSVQTVAFSLGLLIGLWCGVFCKLHPQTVWGLHPEKPAYTAVKTDKVLLFEFFREIDHMMIEDGISFDERHRLLKEASAALDGNRDKETGELAEGDKNAIEAFLGRISKGDPSVAGPKPGPIPVAELFNFFKDTKAG